MTLTHQIVRVDSKDAIDRWGEVAVPAGAEILTLRTHKRDGTTREPEEIAGKETISAADLAIGDYVEWETLETQAAVGRRSRPGSSAIGSSSSRSTRRWRAASSCWSRRPGIDARRSTARAGAPRAARRARAVDGTQRHHASRRTSVPQLFAERVGGPGDRVRPLGARVEPASAGSGWARFLAEQLHGRASRSSPSCASRRGELARSARAGAGGARGAAAAIVDWVTENIEADRRAARARRASRWRAGAAAGWRWCWRWRASWASRRGRVLARSRLVAEADGRCAAAGARRLRRHAGRARRRRARQAGVRLRRPAPAPRRRSATCRPAWTARARWRSPDGQLRRRAQLAAGEDHRTVDMTIRLDEQGGGGGGRAPRS